MVEEDVQSVLKAINALRFEDQEPLIIQQHRYFPHLHFSMLNTREHTDKQMISCGEGPYYIDHSERLYYCTGSAHAHHEYMESIRNFRHPYASLPQYELVLSKRSNNNSLDQLPLIKSLRNSIGVSLVDCQDYIQRWEAGESITFSTRFSLEQKQEFFRHGLRLTTVRNSGTSF